MADYRWLPHPDRAWGGACYLGERLIGSVDCEAHQMKATEIVRRDGHGSEWWGWCVGRPDDLLATGVASSEDEVCACVEAVATALGYLGCDGDGHAWTVSRG